MQPDIEMIRRLDIPDGILDIVIDTDTYNEVDDQFAIVYALKSTERFRVKAIYACPFFKPEYNKRSVSPYDGMTKSYDEILKLLRLVDTKSEGFVFRGASQFLRENVGLVPSESSEHLIKLATENYSPQRPLYVVAIGCLTNIALALLREPKIADRIHLVWLGGTPHTSHRTSEFNLHQDIEACRVVFDSDVAFTQVPCFGVASHLLTNIHELESCVDTTIPVNRYLVETFRSYRDDHFAYSKEIWDIAPFAFLVRPKSFGTAAIVRRPLVTFDETYSPRLDSGFMRVLMTLDRNQIFRDLFLKLNSSGNRSSLPPQ